MIICRSVASAQPLTPVVPGKEHNTVLQLLEAMVAGDRDCPRARGKKTKPKTETSKAGGGRRGGGVASGGAHGVTAAEGIPSVSKPYQNSELAQASTSE